MKVLVTGGKGQLASEIKDIINSGIADLGTYNTKDIECTFIDIEELDITNLKDVKKYIKSVRPDVVINCAAFTNVDECESNEDIAFQVNSLGPRNLAIACESINAKLLQVSTDYVFSGDTESKYREYDKTSPKSIYGKTKLTGEEYVRKFSSKYFIVRTSWLYGFTGKNFVYTILNLAKTNDEIKVVDDQRGTPTNANDLAYHILKLINSDEYGIYHCTGGGECSWYDFASKIVELSNVNCNVVRCTTEEFTRPAKRPKYSVLDNMMMRSIKIDEMRSWEDAIVSFMENSNNK